MTYTAVLRRSDEGDYSVSVPGLPGCWSQGKTRAEAARNIKDTARGYLDVTRQLAAAKASQKAPNIDQNREDKQHEKRS